MEIGKAWSHSWKALRSHPEIFLPMGMQVFVSIVAVAIFFVATGLYAVGNELYSLSNDFEVSYQASVHNVTIDPKNYSARILQFIVANDNESPGYHNAREAYFDSHGWKIEHLTDKVTMRNGIILGIIASAYIVLSFIIGVILSCMVSTALKYATFDWLMVADRMIPSFGSLFLNLLIVLVPPLLAIVLVIAGFALHVALGFFLFFVIGVVYVFYFFIVSARLLVVGPAVFMDKNNPVQALKTSWKLSQGHFWQFFGTSLLVGLISQAASAFVYPLLQVLIVLLFDPLKAWFLLPIALLLACGFIIFQTIFVLFLFACYDTVRPVLLRSKSG